MLFAVSGLENCPVRAKDGEIGPVRDLLFDDRTWAIRWVEIDTGRWLPGRKALIHPSAVAPIELPPKPALPMMSPGDRLELSVNLTRHEIEAGPHLSEEAPVTRDMEALVYDYYAWDPYWGPTHFGGAALPNAEARLAGEAAERETDRPPADGADHLHGFASFKGYAVHARDGDIGHLDNLVADDSKWEIRYLLIATRNWWPGKVVRLAPYAVESIDWIGQRIAMKVTREQVRSAPEWDPLAMIDQAGEDAFHRHFGWPGYRAGG